MTRTTGRGGFEHDERRAHPGAAPPDIVRPPCFMTSFRSVREAWSAGARPKIRLAASDTATANKRTRIIDVHLVDGGVAAGASATSPRIPQPLITTLATPASDGEQDALRDEDEHSGALAPSAAPGSPARACARWRAPGAGC